MDNREFWALIASARDQAGEDENHQASLLVAALVALGVDAIMAFDGICRKFVGLVIDRIDYARSHFVNDIRGEHRLRAIAYGFIALGEDGYYRALAAHDAGDDENTRYGGYGGDPFEFVVPTAYYESTGQDHPDWLGFSEYLVNIQTGDTTQYFLSDDPLSIDEPFISDLPTMGSELLGDLWDRAFYLQIEMANIFYRLPLWKQKTNAGIALEKAGSQISELVNYFNFSIPDLIDDIKKLVPDAPEETAAP